jgi:glycosyltransferase involved in cell wall biosynthesis
MRIAFANFCGAAFSVESAYQVPLGGSESALCYLAEALAQQGHEVFLLNAGQGLVHARGVDCLAAHPEVVKMLQPLDALVVQNLAGWAPMVRPLLASQCRFVLWTQHAHNEPAVQALQDDRERCAYDAFAFVSEWQRSQYLQHFGIDPARTAVLRNALGPAFEALFPDGTCLMDQKSRPPVLAYTSTPYRGLEILLQEFPEIRRAVPGSSLKVFSSMQVSGLPQALDEAQFGQLYRQCRETDGVEYLGLVPQPRLARELRSVAVLAYPNIFPETSCIAVLEAMAAGCYIVTSDLAALPETTAGFARLLPIVNSTDADYRRRFAKAIVEILLQFTRPEAAEAETHLRGQVRYVNEAYIWTKRAQEWAQWLSKIPSRGG